MNISIFRVTYGRFGWVIVFSHVRASLLQYRHLIERASAIASPFQSP